MQRLRALTAIKTTESCSAEAARDSHKLTTASSRPSLHRIHSSCSLPWDGLAPVGRRINLLYPIKVHCLAETRHCAARKGRSTYEASFSTEVCRPWAGAIRQHRSSEHVGFFRRTERRLADIEGLRRRFRRPQRSRDWRHEGQSEIGEIPIV